MLSLTHDTFRRKFDVKGVPSKAQILPLLRQRHNATLGLFIGPNLSSKQFEFETPELRQLPAGEKLLLRKAVNGFFSQCTPLFSAYAKA